MLIREVKAPMRVLVILCGTGAHHRNARNRSDRLIIAVDLGQEHGKTFVPSWSDQEHGKQITAYALVPMIPAEVRNRMKGQVRDHYILWEVEEWATQPLRTEPDRDPLLLRPLAGDLYAVVD